MSALTPAPRRGWFVVLVGPDGVGKTSVARALADAYPGRSGYFHFLPRGPGPLPPGPAAAASVPAVKFPPAGPRVLGWLRLARTFVRCWSGYLRTIRPAVRSGTLVLGDRWVYGYAAQPRALRFAGPAGLARVVLRAVPRPDLIVNLSAPPAVIRQRKGELREPEILGELEAWRRIPARRVRTIEAVGAPSAIAREILTMLTPDRPAPGVDR